MQLAQGSAHGLWGSAPEGCPRDSGPRLSLCSGEKHIMQFEHHVLLLIDLGVHDGFARGRNALIFIFDPLSTNVKLDLFLFKLIEKGKLVNSAPTVGNIHREIRMSKFLPSG